MIVSSSGILGAIDPVALDHRFVHQAAAGKVPAHPPGPAAGERPGVGVEQDVPGIETVPVVPGPVDPVAVAELLRQAVDPHVPVVAGPIVEVVERDLGVDLAVARLGEDQPDRRPVPADQREVDPVGHHDRAQRQRAAPADRQPPVAKSILGAKCLPRRSLHGCHDARRVFREEAGSVPDRFLLDRCLGSSPRWPPDDPPAPPPARPTLIPGPPLPS